MRRFAEWVIAPAILAFSVAALAQAPVKKADDGVWTNDEGMALYTFDRDAGGKSSCNGICAASWPPLKAAADAQPSGDWTIVTRDDGSKQWAYKGKPLYLWRMDLRAGDRNGNGVNNVWHSARE